MFVRCFTTTNIAIAVAMPRSSGRHGGADLPAGTANAPSYVNGTMNTLYLDGHAAGVKTPEALPDNAITNGFSSWKKNL